MNSKLNRKKEHKFQNNKEQYESSVRVGKELYKFILDNHNAANPPGVDCTNVGTWDLTALHREVSGHCQLGVDTTDLQNDLKTLKDLRNNIKHSVDMAKYTDLYIWRAIEELRVLFEKILDGIKDFYGADIDDKKIEINDDLEKILKNVKVEVRDADVDSFLNELQNGKCPSYVMIEIEQYPHDCSNLVDLLESLGEKDVDVWLLINKAYFEDVDEYIFDSQKYLTPLLVNNNSKLTRYRGNLTTDMISNLPASLNQLNIRMRPDQLEHLHSQLPRLTELWQLGLYVDLSKVDNCYEVEVINPESLPVFNFTGKQLGLRICACIGTTDIPWVINVIEVLKMNHQCDTLEFYQTRLNTVDDIEHLLRALKEAGIHVTNGVKLQNERNNKGDAEQAGLDNLAKMQLSLHRFTFMRPWKQGQANASFDTSLDLD